MGDKQGLCLIFDQTYTFHTTQGECTITLQDVVIQLGLPCEATPMLGNTGVIWTVVYENQLGMQPPEREIDGQRLSLT